jgi:hypothetical protein
VLQLSIFAGPGVLAMILAIAGVTTSRPPTPPAPSAAQDSETFFKGLKQVFTSYFKPKTSSICQYENDFRNVSIYENELLINS